MYIDKIIYILTVILVIITTELKCKPQTVKIYLYRIKQHHDGYKPTRNVALLEVTIGYGWLLVVSSSSPGPRRCRECRGIPGTNSGSWSRRLSWRTHWVLRCSWRTVPHRHQPGTERCWWCKPTELQRHPHRFPLQSW